MESESMNKKGYSLSFAFNTEINYILEQYKFREYNKNQVILKLETLYNVLYYVKLKKPYVRVSKLLKELNKVEE